jgi:hypothetical protein
MKDPALAIPYLVLWVAMMRALLVRAQVLPATCNRCGRRYERRELGEAVCSCERARSVRRERAPTASLFAELRLRLMRTR